MAVIRGYTAERMKQIEDTTVIGGSVNPAGDLTLEARDGTEIPVGNIKGPQGDTGIQGPPGHDSTFAPRPALPANADFNTYVTTGEWVSDDAVIRNTLKNTPVDPIPAVGPNLAMNPKSILNHGAQAQSNHTSYYSVTNITGGSASPYGTTSWLQITPIGTPPGNGAVGSVFSVDGLGSDCPYIRTVSLHILGSSGIAMEYRTQGGRPEVSAWQPFTPHQRISWTVPAGAYAILEVRRVGGLSAQATDAVWITDIKSDPGPGILRVGPIGHLKVIETGTRVIQEFHSLVVLEAPGMEVIYRRFRNAGGSWTDWSIDSWPLSVTNNTAWVMAGRQLGAKTPYCTPQIRRMNETNPSTYWTDNGNTWNSTYTTLPIDSPSWNSLVLQGVWQAYAASSAWSHPHYMRTAEGLVILRGLVKTTAAANGTVIGTLPWGYRPAHKTLFTTIGTVSGEGPSRIDVLPNGDVIFQGIYNQANATVGYLSLEGIAFPCAEIAPQEAWTPYTLINGFIDYYSVNASWGPCRFYVDKEKRLWSQGLFYRATSPGTETPYANVPGGIPVPSYYVHTGGYSSGGFVGQGFGGSWIWKGGGGVAYISMPTAPLVSEAAAPHATGWSAITLTSPWTNLGGGWPVASAWRAPDGIIHCRGLLGSPTTGNQATQGSGWRPSANHGGHIFLINNTGAAGRQDINAGGAMSGANISGGSYWSLDGLFYLKEA